MRSWWKTYDNVNTLWERYDNPLSLSKFHVIFQRHTQVFSKNIFVFNYECIGFLHDKVKPFFFLYIFLEISKSQTIAGSAKSYLGERRFYWRSSNYLSSGLFVALKIIGIIHSKLKGELSGKINLRIFFSYPRKKCGPTYYIYRLTGI